jgi:hypothetical protein
MTSYGAMGPAPYQAQYQAPYRPAHAPVSQPSEPALPPGPGVTPPFAAPPTDRDSRTIWIRVGVSSLLLFLACIGGGVGIGVVVAGVSRQLTVQAKAVVNEYLGALRSEEYRHAYDLLCQSTTDRTSLAAFTAREQQRPVTAYQVHGVRTESDLVVGASVTYRGEPAVAREYVVTIEGQLRVCGER